MKSLDLLHGCCAGKTGADYENCEEADGIHWYEDAERRTSLGNPLRVRYGEPWLWKNVVYHDSRAPDCWNHDQVVGEEYEVKNRLVGLA